MPRTLSAPRRPRRAAPRTHAPLVLRGLWSGLRRTTCESIALAAGVRRTPIQSFVGIGKWDDEAVLAALRRDVRAARGDTRAILILDPSAFPQSGTESCGVARQWCGRLGTRDHGQFGVFLTDAAPRGYAPLDRRLDLPKEWAADAARREQCPVAAAVQFPESWRIAVELLTRCRTDLPHAGVTGDDERGRPAQFRGWRRRHHERYVRDAPCHTSVRDLERRRPRRRRAGRGRKREVPFRRAEAWVARQPESRWSRRTIRDGERGRLRVAAMTVRVRTRPERRLGPEERWVVLRTVAAQPRTHDSRSDAGPAMPRIERVRVRCTRHRIEAVLESAQGEVGQARDEVRSWVGWHHQITRSRLALWFLCCERRRVGGENPGGDGVAGAGGVHSAAAESGSESGADRAGGDARVVAAGGGADRQVVQGHRGVSAPPPTTGYELNGCVIV